MDDELRPLLESAARFLRTKYRLAEHEQEELEQEIALAVAKSAHRGGVRDREAYARAIARNVAVTYFRRRKGVQSLDELEAYGEPAPTPTSLEELIRRENHRELYRAIAGIGDDHRRVLLAVYCDGLDPERIAELEGIKPKSVYTRLSRAEAQLRAMLKPRFSTLHRHWEKRIVVPKNRTPEERQVLELHATEGLDARAIARRLLPSEALTEKNLSAIRRILGE